MTAFDQDAEEYLDAAKEVRRLRSVVLLLAVLVVVLAALSTVALLR